jgi:hypothetical protein
LWLRDANGNNLVALKPSSKKIYMYERGVEYTNKKGDKYVNGVLTHVFEPSSSTYSGGTKV